LRQLWAALAQSATPSPSNGGAGSGVTTLAVYGAVVATVAVGWQIYTWFQEKQNKVSVALSNVFLVYGRDTVEAIGVRVTNRNDHPVWVQGWGFDAQDGSGQLVVTNRGPVDEFPGEVAAHHSKSVRVAFDDVPSVDRYKPLVAWVNLSTGETIRSKRATLRKP
jgi:hypothetical protein